MVGLQKPGAGLTLTKHLWVTWLLPQPGQLPGTRPCRWIP
jgi:hypothetical protein